MADVDPESGFLGKTEMIKEDLSVFTDVKILTMRKPYFIASGSRYGRRWALKGLSTEYSDSTVHRQQLLKEFKILSSLSHPGIVSFAGMEEVEGLGLCIIMEWIEGPTLEQELRSGQLTVADRHRLLSEIVEAIAHIHYHGIVHRDLKLSNILIRQNGRKAVIIDFGLADTDAFTILKSPAGTPGYISERQQEADTPFTGDDVYSLGVIMQMLCPEYRTIIKKATGKPECRYRDGADLLAAIRRRQTRGKRLMRQGAIAVAVMALAAISLLAYRNGRLADSNSLLHSSVEDLQHQVMTLDTAGTYERRMMSDSIGRLSHRLKAQNTYRDSVERHASFITDAKRMMRTRLEKELKLFIAQHDNRFDEGLTISLARNLQAVKEECFASLPPLDVNDRAELESAFQVYYEEMGRRWNNMNPDKE